MCLKSHRAYLCTSKTRLAAECHFWPYIELAKALQSLQPGSHPQGNILLWLIASKGSEAQWWYLYPMILNYEYNSSVITLAFMLKLSLNSFFLMQCALHYLVWPYIFISCKMQEKLKQRSNRKRVLSSSI